MLSMMLLMLSLPEYRQGGRGQEAVLEAGRARGAARGQTCCSHSLPNHRTSSFSANHKHILLPPTFVSTNSMHTHSHVSCCHAHICCLPLLHWVFFVSHKPGWVFGSQNLVQTCLYNINRNFGHEFPEQIATYIPLPDRKSGFWGT